MKSETTIQIASITQNHLIKFIQKKNKIISENSFNPGEKKPAIKCSICNGEQVAGFVNLESGAFEDVMLLRNEKDLQIFKKKYGIEGDIEKIY